MSVLGRALQFIGLCFWILIVLGMGVGMAYQQALSVPLVLLLLVLGALPPATVLGLAWMRQRTDSMTLSPEHARRLLEALEQQGILQRVDENGRLAYVLVERLAEGEQPMVLPESAANIAPAVTLPEPLSDRERDVLRWLVAGLSNKEIAEKLAISEGTVKTHTNSIYRKLGARNRAEAAVKARDLGLL